MRHTRALTVAGTVRTNTFGVRQVVVLVAIVGALAWGGVAFAQEAFISHGLSEQVKELRRQHAEIAAQNAGYKQDVQALQSATANEDEARRSGYVRADVEK